MMTQNPVCAPVQDISAPASWWHELAALARNAQANQPPGDITRLVGAQASPWAGTNPDEYVREVRDDWGTDDAA